MYDYSAIFERIKSTDFPLKCRGMYYFSKGRHAHQERKGLVSHISFTQEE